jgi:signal peptidase I
MQPNKNQQPQQARAPQISVAPSQAVITPRIKRWRIFKSGSDLIVLVIVTVAACWLILTYVVGFTEVNGISMQPTLYTGNVLVVWKLPQTWAKITRGQYIPKRSNVVIVEDTNNSGELFVKRVIGLPGERIYIANGVVTVYNSNYPSGINPDKAAYGQDLIATGGSFSGQVGAGQIFVMGDNRAAGASIDSRSSLGNIPSGNIVGQVILRVYPFDKIKTF